MGIVFRARDAKLQREVALKLLPDHFAGDPERLARFQREAQVLASLNHPNIAQVHGLEESAGTPCIVMELVEGDTIQDRLKLGAMPIDDALQIARQVAEALEAAHEKGIVHRDLKPANIKIAPGHKVKVLDFGLAKTLLDAQSVTLSNSPTLMSASVPGMILGTAAYMSPEQAKGQDADHTTDVWAFGCVLYEMVTGAPVFDGGTVSEIIAGVLKSEPDWNRLPADTPENVRRLLRRCLQKDRKRRLQNIGDARIEIEDAPAAPAAQQTPIKQSDVGRRERLAWVIGVTLLGVTVLGFSIGLTFLSTGSGREAIPDRPLVRLRVDLGPEAMPGTMITAAISPDGARIVFPWRNSDGAQILATRKLDESRVTPLPGTEDAVNPFFSRDGRWIGFVSRGSLKKVLVEGGAPITLANIANPRGATWAADDYIIAPLSNGRPLSLIPAAGGETQLLTELDGDELSQRWPQILPDGRAVIFTGRSPTLNSYENATIDAFTITTKERRTLWRGGYFGRYVPSRGTKGHLLYIHEGVLFGVPFDPQRLELEGTPSAIVEGVATDPISGGGQFDVSTNGTLVFLDGPGTRSWSMLSLDASGKTEPLQPKPGMYYSPRFSPDGRRLAFAVEAGNGSDIFVYDFASQSTTRLTFSQQGNIEPLWTPDGKHIVYRSTRPRVLWWIRADGGEPVRLTSTTDQDILPTSFSLDGTRLVYQEGGNVFILPLDLSDPDRPKPGTREPLLSSPANETFATFSLDGRWIAYVSNESGRNEVYVRRSSVPAGKWQISAGGGNFAMWSRTGHEIFYVGPDNRIMVAEYQTSGDSFVVRKTRQWSSTQIFSPGFVPLNLSPDGKRVALLEDPALRAEKKENLHVTFLLNFFDELRRRAPVTGK